MCMKKNTLQKQFKNEETHPHVLLKYICTSVNLNYVVNNKFAVCCQQVSPLVQSFDFSCFIILLPICSKMKI